MTRKNCLSMLVLVLFLTASTAQGANLLLTCDVGGAKLEYYNSNNVWIDGGSFPRIFVGEIYDYILIRVTAPGYKELELGCEMRSNETTHINVQLELEDTDPRTLSLFAMGGRVISKRGLSILPNTYTVLGRNVTTHVPGVDTQRTQDYNPNAEDGWYSCTLADFGTNRAVAVGDKIFIGVFNHSKTRCYGYVYTTVKSEDLTQGCILRDITIK